MSDQGMFSETTHEKQEDAWAGEILGTLWVFQTKLPSLVAYIGEVPYLSYKLLQDRMISINHTSQMRKGAFVVATVIVFVVKIGQEILLLFKLVFKSKNGKFSIMHYVNLSPCWL